MISGNIIINFRQLKINQIPAISWFSGSLSVSGLIDLNKRSCSLLLHHVVCFSYSYRKPIHTGVPPGDMGPVKKNSTVAPTSFILQTMRAQKYNTVQTSIFCLDNYILWLCASLMRFLMLMFANGWYLILKTNKIYLYYCLEIYIYLLNAQFVWSTYNFAVHVQ